MVIVSVLAIFLTFLCNDYVVFMLLCQTCSLYILEEASFYTGELNNMFTKNINSGVRQNLVQILPFSNQEIVLGG